MIDKKSFTKKEAFEYAKVELEKKIKSLIRLKKKGYIGPWPRKK